MLNAIATIAALTQALAMILGMSRYKRNKSKISENIVEILLLITTVTASVALIEYKLLTDAAAFRPFFAITMVLIFLRSIWTSYIYWRELKSEISELSIKQAIDALPTAILFYDRDGRIHLMNRLMQTLMLDLCGEIQHNGRTFTQHLHQEAFLVDDETQMTSDKRVYHRDNGDVYLFSIEILNVGRHSYYQLTASEVSEKWHAATVLKEQNAMLDRRAAELQETLASIHSIIDQEERLRTKSHIHNTFGQHIAVLLRSLREQRLPDEAVLRSFSEVNEQYIYQLNQDKHASTRLETMIRLFTTIGINIQFNGEIPDNEPLADLFVEIITESVTNAVRHAFAEQIRIESRILDDQYQLIARNSGLPPDKIIVEGNGISDMRRQLSHWGGYLDIQTEPYFILTAVIPKGGQA